MYNFRTQQKEPIEGFPPSNRLVEFIPQDAASQGMFNCLIQLGHTPEYAFCKVLDSVTKGSGTASLLDAYLARN